MIGTKELCALLLGGAVGGTGVAVVKDSPRPSVAKAKQLGAGSLSGLNGARSGQPRQPPAAPHRPAILDCPTPGPVPFGALPSLAGPLAELPAIGSDAQAFVPPSAWAPPAAGPGGGGGGLPPVPPPPSPPAVPEPGQWAMLIAGWGFVGLSFRRRKPA